MGPAGLPYGPFAEALRGAVAAGTLDPGRLHPAAVDQLARLLPDFNPRGGADVPEVDLVGLGQVRLFEAFLAAIESVRAVRPVVLVIEDIHWADRSTLDLLTFLVRNTGSAGCMILATVRTDAMERGDPLATFLAELGRWPSVERIDLRPLDLRETTEHLRDVLGVDPSDDLAQRIHRRSDGNPFFIEQLAKAQVDGEPSNVPASLRDILLTQLSQQPRDVQDLLSAAAVAGPLADDSLLASILGCSSEAMLVPLRAAVRARLLVPLVIDGGEVYAFRHALMAEATEADLLDGERRRLHGRCADALIPRRPDEGAALAQWAVRCAHHREHSGDIDATIAASIEAAIETATVAAHADAMEQYHRAIRLLPLTQGTRVWGDWDVSELYGRAAACAALIGEAVTAASYSRRAIEQLPADADPWRRGQLLNAWSEHLWIAGEADFAVALVEAARVDPGRTTDGDPGRSARIAGLLPPVLGRPGRGPRRARRSHRHGRGRRIAPGGGDGAGPPDLDPDRGGRPGGRRSGDGRGPGGHAADAPTTRYLGRVHEPRVGDRVGRSRGPVARRLPGGPRARPAIRIRDVLRRRARGDRRRDPHLAGTPPGGVGPARRRRGDTDGRICRHRTAHHPGRGVDASRRPRAVARGDPGRLDLASRR